MFTFKCKPAKWNKHLLVILDIKAHPTESHQSYFMLRCTPCCQLLHFIPQQFKTTSCRVVAGVQSDCVLYVWSNGLTFPWFIVQICSLWIGIPALDHPWPSQYFTLPHEFQWIPLESCGMVGMCNSCGFPWIPSGIPGKFHGIPEWFLWIPSGIWMEFPWLLSPISVKIEFNIIYIKDISVWVKFKLKQCFKILIQLSTLIIEQGN